MKLPFLKYTEQKKQLRDQYHYSDWFGNGNTIDDIEEVIKTEKRNPKYIWLSEHMALIDFGDSITVIGYDGNEYQCQFNFTKVD